jgi:hypothetical protein
MTKRRTGNRTMSDAQEDIHREFLLTALRAASLRAKTWDADMTTIGVALRNGLIGSNTALAWIREAGLGWIVGAIPEEVGRVAQTTWGDIDQPDEVLPRVGNGGAQ